MSELTAAALEWAADGIPVFPCGPNKRPMTTNGFYDATTDPKAIKQMFDLAGPDVLIGARMGATSGLFACDFDIYKPGAAGEASKQYMAQLLADGVLPETQRHATMNGGLHLIYQSEHGYPNCVPSDGVEIKGEGGYIILPPSRGYSIDNDVGFTVAPKALIDILIRSKRVHTDKTVSQHEEAIIAGDRFHDSITSIAAKMFRRGRSAGEIIARINAALAGSVASNPSHPRHERWLSLSSDVDGEVARILNSGREKYDSRAKTEAARDNVDPDMAAKMADMAAKLGFAPSPEQRDEQHGEQAGPKVTPEDYAGKFPFEGEGYYAHEELNIQDQRFNIYPIYAENESVVLAADPKAGKTAISLKLAVHMAAGRSLGPFTITDARAVLYFALEGTRAIKLRLEAEKRKQIEDGTPLPDDLPLFVVERSPNFLAEQEKTVAKVVAAARHFEDVVGVPLGLVVVDTLTKAMPGADQNSVDDTSKLFDFTTQLRSHGVKATVVFVHHTGKDGGTRGSSNIEAEVDVVLKMKKQDDGSTSMYVHMARSIDDNRTYNFTLEGYDLGVTEQGIAQSAPIVTLREGNPAETNESTETAMRAHKVAPFLKAIILLGAGKHTLETLVTHFRDLGLTIGRQRGKPVIAALDLIFDREQSVTFAGNVITVEKDGTAYKSVTVR